MCVLQHWMLSPVAIGAGQNQQLCRQVFISNEGIVQSDCQPEKMSVKPECVSATAEWSSCLAGGELRAQKLQTKRCQKAIDLYGILIEAQYAHHDAGTLQGTTWRT